MIQNVLMHLTLSIKRIEQGLELQSFTLDAAFIDSMEYHCAKNIIDKLKAEWKIQFPEEEVAYLTLHLGAKNNGSINVSTPGIEEQEIDQVLTSMEENLGIPICEDSMLKKCLLEHLRPMMIRVHQGIALKNPLLKEIMSEHKDIYEYTRTYLSQMPSLQHKPISNDEWAYLTLHFMAAFERLSNQNKLQILVICSTGYGSAQLLKSRIEKEFADAIHVVHALGYYEMNENALQGIDLIISSVNLDSVIFGIPCLHVSVFLDEKDKTTIDNFVKDSLLKRKQLKEEQHNEKITFKEKEDIFHIYMRQEYFQCFNEDITLEAILQSMLHRLSYKEHENYTKQMMDQMKLREQMSSVIFSDTIAVPHPAIPVGNQTSIAIGIVPNGVYWNENAKNIKIIFLLSPSYLGNQGLKCITKAIIRLLDAKDTEEKVLKCETFQAFKNIFLSLM